MEEDRAGGVSWGGGGVWDVGGCGQYTKAP